MKRINNLLILLMIFFDYIEGYFSSDLQHVINYQLGNKYDGQSTSMLDMDCLPLGVSLQPTLSFDSKYCYFHQSQRIFHPFCGNQQVELHENKDAVEGVKHDCCFMYVLEDPFAILLEAAKSPNVFNFFRFEFIDKFLNDLLVNKIWRKHVKRKKKVDKVFSWLHWHFDFTLLTSFSADRVGRSVNKISTMSISFGNLQFSCSS
jgi:hypothetical protein